MGKTCKVVVCGQAAVGKTAVLEQLVNGDHVVGSVGLTVAFECFLRHSALALYALCMNIQLARTYVHYSHTLLTNPQSS
jgi:GTPase SAR1 family protein